MRRIVYLSLVVCFVSGLANAQTQRSGGQFNTFVAPGAIVSDRDSTASMHYGFGGEVFVYKGLSAGGEVGYYTPARAHDEGFGIFSANGAYHFKSTLSDGKVVPFVTGGYSLFFRGNTANGFNVGGGVNYWFKERLGLRVEFRDQVLPQNRATHFLGVRVGLSWR